MASILLASGFQNLESLQDFCNRFSNVSACLPGDLEKVWISHKNPGNIPKSEDINLLPTEEYHCLLSKVKKKISAGRQFYNLLTEFSAYLIFNQIYSEFQKQLATYIFTNCYLFYNWGTNAFEPIIDHYEIHNKIQKSQKQPYIAKQRVMRHNFFQNPCVSENGKRNSEENRERSVDLFDEPAGPSKKSKTVSFKSVIEACNKAEKFCDIVKNPRNAYHEVFCLKKVLYDLKQRSSWPRKHVLSKNNVEDLLLFIIRIPLVTSGTIERRLLDEHHNWLLLRGLLTKFLKTHERITQYDGYGRILKKHLKYCKMPQRKLHPIPKSLVCSYVLDILRRVLPLEIFGRNSVRKSFFSGLVKIINGSKSENFIWYTLLRTVLMNKSSLPWCAQISDFYSQSQFLLKLYKFIVLHYIFVILKNHFYITETGTSCFGLRFYRKTDMERASSACLNNLIKNGHVRELNKKEQNPPASLERNWLNTGIISEEDLKRKLKKTMQSGTEYKQPVVRVRFLPKSDDGNELRIITNIERRPKVSRSGNQKLEKYFEARLARRKKNLFLVRLFLEFLVDKIGSGFRPLPCNPKLEDAWKKAVHLKEKYGKLFFVKADISDAFDSVDYKILSEILRNAFEKEAGLGNVQLMKIIEWKKVSGRIQKVARFSFSNRSKENSVMINRSAFLHHNRRIRQYINAKFLQIIEQVVTEQKVEIKGKVFKLVKGLAQGSAGRFSPQLCEIYYSFVDGVFFRELIESKNSVFLRGVDDYLFVTPELGKAVRFLELVRRGFPEYNVRFNGQKLKSNLIEDVEEISYLGLIFNFENMSVKPNYFKSQREHLSTINMADKWGNNHFNKQLFLQRRLFQFKCLKLHSIVVNGVHNNLKTMRRTIFEACLMQSVRVLSLANYLFTGRVKNDCAVYQILLISCAKIKRLLAHCEVSPDEVSWIFFFACLNISRKFSGQFKLLLLIIRYRLEKCERDFSKKEADLLLKFLKDDVLDEDYWNKVGGVFKELGRFPLKSV